MPSQTPYFLANFSEILRSYTLSIPIRGELGYLKLSNWWMTEFTAIERSYIESIYQPIGANSDGSAHLRPLTEGESIYPGLTVTLLLSCLASWFRKPDEWHLAQRILAKAEQALPDETDLLNTHFFWSVKQQLSWTNREHDPEAMMEAIRSAQQQILIASQVARSMKLYYSNSVFPKHEGFQLLINLSIEKNNHLEAIRLCKEAKSQGWSGNWEEQITRYAKLIAKERS